MNVTFIGGGLMAEALISGILKAGIDCRISVGDPLAQRRKYLSERYAVTVASENASVLSGADIAVIAVKPQQLGDVAAEFESIGVKLPTVISIMAGVRMDTIRDRLHCGGIVRVMPNTPAQIGQGATAWTASSTVDAEALRFTERMLDAVGEQIYFDDEKLVEIATALSASGPAYVFVFIESLIDGAVQLGMPISSARELAVQMVLGSASLAKSTGLHPAELRNMVTSPGGTTAAALHAMESKGFRFAAIEAVLTAHRRGDELGQIGKE